ncbi:MAG: dTDP-4-dehydrorhamnose reductase [Thermoanaerobaculia bacterium]|nr:dTDP-4-dehydrorhamnose reductase [Thermoanaerobaculia bacterium]
MGTRRSLVFGGTGMLGSAVVREVRRQGGTALGLSHLQGDITEPVRIAEWMKRFQPQVIYNCAAMTRVDDCESEEELAFRVNGEAVGYLTDAAALNDIPLVHVSSDYVFDGRAESPYREDHPTSPVSVYGRSKLAGEHAALRYPRSLVVRASWLFGPGGGNFVATMLRLISSGTSPLRVVDDQLGGPTYTPFLATALVDLVAGGATGIVHYQNRDPVTWYGLTCRIAEHFRPTVEVLPVTTEEFPRPAPRPAYSVLDVSRCEGLLGRPVERWDWGLYEYLKATYRLRSDR